MGSVGGAVEQRECTYDYSEEARGKITRGLNIQMGEEYGSSEELWVVIA